MEHFVLAMVNCHPYPTVQCWELPIPSTACQNVPTFIDGEGEGRMESDDIFHNSVKVQEKYLNIIFAKDYFSVPRIVLKKAKQSPLKVETVS